MNIPALLPAVEPLEARIAPAAVASIALGALDGKTGFRVSGVADGDYAGQSVSAAGDVNGDGFGDFIVGAKSASDAGGKSGAAYVIFGRADGFPSGVALATMDAATGFRLDGLVDRDLAGVSVAAAGDVNGDGFADLIIGAPGADEGGTDRGAAYVVFGKAGGFGGSLALSSLNGANGFKLSGGANSDLAGISVAGAGDVNGDGFDDVIVGAYRADEGGTDRGAAYVVFGKASGFSASVSLAALDGGSGFKIPGIATGDRLGTSVSGAGDVNGDGFADLIVGAPLASGGGIFCGESYVVFGKAGGFGASFALSALNGSNGFKLSGVANGDNVGASVSSAGDVNGDGFADVVVGAAAATTGIGNFDGAAYVVFGKANGFAPSLALGSLDGSTGFKLAGSGAGHLGASVQAAGDVNGDGFADVIVGAYAYAQGGTNRGAAYVVFGKTGGFSASLSAAMLDGTNGFRLDGASDNDGAGNAVSSAGDLNGDGFADLIVGASGLDGGYSRGGAYVVYGHGTAEVTVATGGKTATFTDWDGDLVTIKTSAGKLDATLFKLSSPNPATGGSHLLYADFTNATTGTDFSKATLSFIAKRGPMGGDGLVNVGTLDARGTDLGKVSIDGDLQQIDAGNVAGLTIYSLGRFAVDGVHGGPITSELGEVGALTVKTTATGVTLSAVKFGAIKALALDDVTLYAAGHTGDTASETTALKSLTVAGDVRGSHFLIGRSLTSSNVLNPDVQVGAVKVGGDWIASDLIAGVRAGDDGIYATGDPNESAPTAGTATLFSRIASITIKGAVLGTAGARDGFGFAAQEIGSFTLGKAKLPLVKKAGTDLTPFVLAITGDVRVCEVAV